MLRRTFTGFRRASYCCKVRHVWCGCCVCRAHRVDRVLSAVLTMFTQCFRCPLFQVDGSYLLDGKAIQPKEFKRMSGYVMQVSVGWARSLPSRVVSLLKLLLPVEGFHWWFSLVTAACVHVSFHRVHVPS